MRQIRQGMGGEHTHFRSKVGLSFKIARMHALISLILPIVTLPTQTALRLSFRVIASLETRQGGAVYHPQPIPLHSRNTDNR